MKKVLSLLGLIAILSSTVPCYAHGGGPMGGHGGQIVQAGPHHGGNMGRPPMDRNWGAPPPPPRYNRGTVFVGGVLARRSCWGYSDCYYNRLGCYDDFYYPPRPPRPPIYNGGMYINVGFPIRF